LAKNTFLTIKTDFHSRLAQTEIERGAKDYTWRGWVEHEILLVLPRVVQLASALAIAALALVRGAISSPSRKVPALCILWKLV